jgi:CubicO group peptidase (beta-lactamase class C family)
MVHRKESSMKSVWTFPLMALLALIGGLNTDLNAALDNYCDNLGCVSASRFSANLDSQLQGKVVGYVSVVGAKTVEYGSARTDADPPSRKMAMDVPINVASVSKVLTTIAVLQSLAKHHLTIESTIAQFLPPDWSRGPNVNTITFRQLMTHRAGFRDNGNATTYEALQQQIQHGVQLVNKQTPAYNNLNFAIFRVLLPYMEGFNDPGPATRPEATANFYISYMRQHVFQPVGITDADCKPGPDRNPALYYPFPPDRTHGVEAGDWTPFCGGGGWVLTASDLFKVVQSLVHDNTLLTKAQKKRMNQDCLGWDCSVAVQTDYRCKNGALLYGNSISEQTFIGIFKDKLGVVLLINSQPPSNITSVVVKAFNDAAHPFHTRAAPAWGPQAGAPSRLPLRP